MALAGDLAGKKLRNLPAALDLPALTRLPESQRYPPAFGTTIVPVLIAELTKPDRQGSQRNSVGTKQTPIPASQAGRRETGAGTKPNRRSLQGHLGDQCRTALVDAADLQPATYCFHPVLEADQSDPLPRSAPPTPSSCTDSRTPQASAATLSVTVDACACLAALVRASAAT